jgi:hypothetical protein
MKCLLIPAAVLLWTASGAAQQLDGSFTLRANDPRDKADSVNLNLQYGDGHSNYGRSFDRAAFSDVSRSGDKITFTLRRDPGTFKFEGRGSMDRAAGWYDFTPSATFGSELERIGFRNVDARALFVFALDDLSVAKVKTLKGLVSNELDTEELVQLINHGAGVKYIQAMTDLGFKKLSSEEYRRARDHGVSERFVREMSDLGFKPSLDDLVRARDHGVSADFIRAMRDAGYKLQLEELVRARDHGVSTEFMRRMGALGYDKLPLDEYVRMRDHGVTPDFVEGMRAEGFKNLSAEELVRLRDHGVTASYARRVRELFKETPSVEQIIRMRSRGDIGSR